MSTRTVVPSATRVAVLLLLGVWVSACAETSTPPTSSPGDDKLAAAREAGSDAGSASPGSGAPAVKATPGVKKAQQIPVNRVQDRDPEEEKRKMARSRELSGKAMHALRAGDMSKAVLESRQALKVHEQNTEAMLIIAEAFYKQGRYEIVESVTNSVLKIDPNVLSAKETSKAYNLKGFAYLSQGKRGLAMQAFRKAADTDNENASAWNNLGVQFMWQGDDATAASCFQYATELDPSFAGAHLNHGAALRAQGKLIEAEAAFKRVLQLHPSKAEAHFNLGVLYLDAEAFPNIDERTRLNRSIKELTRYKELAVASGPSRVGEVADPNRVTQAGLGNELVSPAQADLYVAAAKKDIDRIARREKRDADRKSKAAKKAADDAAKKAEADAAAEEAAAQEPSAQPSPQPQPQPSAPKGSAPASPKPQAPNAQAPNPQAPKPQAPKPQAPGESSPAPKPAPNPAPAAPKPQAPKPQAPGSSSPGPGSGGSAPKPQAPGDGGTQSPQAPKSSPAPGPSPQKPSIQGPKT